MAQQDEGFLIVPDELINSAAIHDPSYVREIFDNYEEIAQGLELGTDDESQEPTDEDTGDYEDGFDVSRTAQDLGVPDKWLVDAKTGKPYDNGLIFGKWKTKEAAEEGIVNERQYIGKRFEDIDMDEFKRIKGIEDDGGQDGYPLQARDFLNDDQVTKLDGWAMDKAREELAGDPRFLNDLNRKGIPIPESSEDWDLLEESYASLYSRVEKRRDQLFQEGEKIAAEHFQLQEHLPEVEVSAIDAAFVAFRDEMIQQTGIDPDDGDEAILMEMFNRNIERIQEDRPAGTYMNRAGVWVPDSRGIFEYILHNERGEIAKAIRHSAAQQATRGYENTMNGRRSRVADWPALPSQQGGGEDGSSYQGAALDDLLSDGYIDKIATDLRKRGMPPEKVAREAVNEWNRQLAQAEQRDNKQTRQPQY
jgi:hypothetical protein